jgi:hypothetical protein
MPIDDIKVDSILILRCCRDWPCHFGEAVHMGGRCGICRRSPGVIWENYPQEMYARNRVIEPDTLQ